MSCIEPFNDDLEADGDKRWVELPRREGARLGVIPLEECKEFIDVFRNSVGVPDRDCDVNPFELVLFTGLREGGRAPGDVEDNRGDAYLGFAFATGDLDKRDAAAVVGEPAGEVERDSLFNERRSSRSSLEFIVGCSYLG